MYTFFDALAASKDISCTRPHLVAPGVFSGEIAFCSTNGVDCVRGYYLFPHANLEDVRAVIQVVHGRSEHLLRHRCWIDEAVRAGFAVIGHDHLGHGLTQPNLELRGHLEVGRDAEALIDDVIALRQSVQTPEIAAIPWILFGHSMGSLIVRVVISKPMGASGLAGAVICGTCWEPPFKIEAARLICMAMRRMHHARYRSPWLESQVIGAFNKPFEPANTPCDWISSIPGEGEAYLADPNCAFSFTVGGNEAMMRIFGQSVSHRTLANTPSHLPIYIVSGAQDSAGRFGKAPVTLGHLLRQAGGKRVRVRLWEHSRHEVFRDVDGEQMQKELIEVMSSMAAEAGQKE